MQEEQARQRLRVVLCMGEYCNLGRRADILYRLLDMEIGDINAEYPRGERPVKLEAAGCLSRCAMGPVCVVYPDDVTYDELDPESLQELVDRYLTPLEKP
jgi:(2Fe-2S) ferredoxin